MNGLTLDLASTIVDIGLKHAREKDMRPICIAVLDAGGHVLCLKREETAGILRPEIATGKAWACLGMGYGGRAMAERAKIWPTFHVQIAVASGGRVIAPAGGVLILDAVGEVIGSVGVTGDTEDNDESCALLGIAAVGLAADTGASLLATSSVATEEPFG